MSTPDRIAALITEARELAKVKNAQMLAYLLDLVLVEVAYAFGRKNQQNQTGGSLN
ncbi:hypothetical protein [Mesorhizobium sp. CAU 1741]|uniref:hypothetical protein n=1 Tax=Mesorhizobium sp. CAU 1741 TaxID=3140366 RepID=UPI00325B3F0E